MPDERLNTREGEVKVPKVRGKEKKTTYGSIFQRGKEGQEGRHVTATRKKKNEGIGASERFRPHRPIQRRGGKPSSSVKVIEKVLTTSLRADRCLGAALVSIIAYKGNNSRSRESGKDIGNLLLLSALADQKGEKRGLIKGSRGGKQLTLNSGGKKKGNKLKDKAQLGAKKGQAQLLRSIGRSKEKTGTPWTPKRAVASTPHQCRHDPRIEKARGKGNNQRGRTAEKPNIRGGTSMAAPS